MIGIFIQVEAVNRQMTQATEPGPDWQTLHQMIRKAQQKLNVDAWDYIAGGTETETTLRRNRHALDNLARIVRG